MSSIFDQIIQSQQNTPTTVEEYIALQLAKGLNDELAVKRYMHYVGHYTIEHLLHLFCKAKQAQDPAREFHSSLTPSEP